MMKQTYHSIYRALLVALVVFFACMINHGLRAAFVYDNGGELLTSGDFNGDGAVDILVLDKSIGNARVGYVDDSGTISWSAPLVSGTPNVSSVAVGQFLSAGTDAIAVTAQDFNRVNLVNLSNSNNAGTPLPIITTGIGPHSLVALTNPPTFSFSSDPVLLIGSSDNTPTPELLESIQFSSGNPTPVNLFPESGSFERGNALTLSPADAANFAAGMVRGEKDRFDILQFTNAPGGILLSLSNLPPGSDYVFGNFEGETFPRIIFFQRGTSNVTVYSLTTNAGSLAFGTNRQVTLSEAVQNVFYLASSNSGTLLVQFEDGVQGVNLAAGLPVLGAVYRNGLGASGNVFTGLVPLPGGQFALLDSVPGSPSSSHAQIVSYDGAHFMQRSSGPMPGTASRSTRANVWLLQNEPFVERNPGFIASYSLPDWSDSLVSLTPSIVVVSETDSGSTTGLGSQTTNTLGTLPAGANYALANQYRDSISVFSYAAPRVPDAVSVTISPSPGVYSGPVQLSFTTLSASDAVYYRTAGSGNWHQYQLPFFITNSSTVQYYGSNTMGFRSRLLTADFSIASSIPPVSAYDVTNGTVTTNVNSDGGSGGSTSSVVLSKGGTIFYSRVNLNDGSIWAIGLDGSGDKYITTGARPRASRDGRYIAFSRGTNVYQVSGGDVWIRDLSTGVETEIFPNQPPIVGYDWDLSSPPNLILDTGCNFVKVSLGGGVTTLPLSHDCSDKAPSINPTDGSVAFDNLNSLSTNLGGLYVGTTDGLLLRHLVAAGAGARWPAWSPDGSRLSYVLLTNAYSSQSTVDIYTIHADGTLPSQISAHTNNIDGFPYGTLWTPSGNALVGAGTINGTNGLWLIPLTDDAQHCDCPAKLLPTTAGDHIDFAGSIVSAPGAIIPNPDLYIRTTRGAEVVYWSTNYQGFALEYSESLGTNAAWIPLLGPYFINNGYFEYHEDIQVLQQKRFYRLRYPNLIYITPLQPTMVLSYGQQSGQVVVSWPTNYVGYFLEAATNLAAPVIWSPVVNGTQVTTTSGTIEFRKNMVPGSAREFFRLRWP